MSLSQAPGVTWPVDNREKKLMQEIADEDRRLGRTTKATEMYPAAEEVIASQTKRTWSGVVKLLGVIAIQFVGDAVVKVVLPSTIGGVPKPVVALAIEGITLAVSLLMQSLGNSEVSDEEIAKAVEVAVAGMPEIADMAGGSAKREMPPERMPLPVTVPETPPSTGSFFICGGGSIPREVFEEIVKKGGGKKAKVVVISTASEKADKDHNVLNFWKGPTDVASLKLVHTRDKGTANSEAFARAIDEADIVYFAGGWQNRLTEAYLDTEAQRAFEKARDRGAILCGTSAGAAIMSKNMMCAGEIEPGLGLYPDEKIVFDQHFSERGRAERLKRALRKLGPGYTGIGIDEGTALVVVNGEVKVMGRGGVHIYTTSETGEIAEKIVRSDMEKKNMGELTTALSKMTMAR